MLRLLMRKMRPLLVVRINLSQNLWQYSYRQWTQHEIWFYPIPSLKKKKILASQAPFRQTALIKVVLTEKDKITLTYAHKHNFKKILFIIELILILICVYLNVSYNITLSWNAITEEYMMFILSYTLWICACAFYSWMLNNY